MSKEIKCFEDWFKQSNYDCDNREKELMLDAWDACVNSFPIEDLITQAREPLLKALEEIAKGEGPYDIDQLKHASNTIDNMKEIANKAIKGKA